MEGSLVIIIDFKNVSFLGSGNSFSRNLLRDVHECEKGCYLTQRYLKWLRFGKDEKGI